MTPGGRTGSTGRETRSRKVKLLTQSPTASDPRGWDLNRELWDAKSLLVTTLPHPLSLQEKIKSQFPRHTSVCHHPGQGRHGIVESVRGGVAGLQGKVTGVTKTPQTHRGRTSLIGMRLWPGEFRLGRERYTVIPPVGSKLYVELLGAHLGSLE